MSRIVNGLCATLRIPALRGRQGQDPQVAAVAQAIVYLQTGRALVAVDEYQSGSSAVSPSPSILMGIPYLPRVLK